MTYEEKLAREILTRFNVENSKYYPSISKDNEFIRYGDEQIEIVAAVNTNALCITIYPPLTEARSNPIVFIDDEGKCYRNHGERSSFNLYAENLLGLPRKTFFNEWSKEKEERILATLQTK